MPFQPQRFIHAANVRLDVPVSVYLSEQLTDELRHQLEDATISSFDCVIDNCIQRKVDYLLLSGNLFVEADRSLRARLALLAGFRRLRKQGIHVFVLPGDTDPPEAWRAIPELPDNVQVCYSSNPEPVAMVRGSRALATVSASMWYGETDAFGIRVIHSSPDGVEPFRIGTVSRARFDESRRMARLAESVEDSLISLEDETNDNTPVLTDTETESKAEYEVAFGKYMSKLMREGRLNYLALGSELRRTYLNFEEGVVHCPGTTQPRSQLEADSGLCSLIIVDATGHVTCEEINTSAVDWKNITLRLAAETGLNQLLEQMRESLGDMPCSPSDQIWSVCWTLTGPLPVLRSFEEDDVELAVAVELDQLDVERRPVRLLHQVRMLPDAWDLDDADHLAQQYADLIPEDAEIDPAELRELATQEEITEGWAKRLEALANGIDRQRLLAQLRNDGADWFVSDLEELYPAQPMLTDVDQPGDTTTSESIQEAAGSASTVAVADEDNNDESTTDPVSNS
jgi:DNA repair exonuclease SbcCD nuclease subunit